MTLKWLELQIAFGKRDLHFLQKSMFIQSDLSIVYLYDLYYGAQGCPSCGFSPKSALRVTWLIPTCVRLFGMYDMLICVTRYMSKKLTRTRRSWRGHTNRRFVWDITHSASTSDSYETWIIPPQLPIRMRHDSLAIRMRHDSIIWDMTHSYETWLIHMRHDSFIWDMTHSYETWLIHIRHDSFIWDMTHSYETWLIHMRHDSFISDMTHSYETW